MFQSLQNKFTPYFKKTYSSKDILLFAFAILCLNILANLFSKYFLGLTFPYDTFLLYPEDRFADFFKVIDALHVVETWEAPNPYDRYWYVYAIPFGTVYYYFFAKLILLSKSKYFIYVVLNIVLLGSHFMLSKKTGNRFGIILLSILSYPIIFTIDRGNYAFAVYLLIFFALTTDRVIPAALAIAMATSLKITPAIFIIPVILMKPFSVRRAFTVILFFGIFLCAINLFSVKLIESQLATVPFNYSEFVNLIGFYYQDDIANLGRMAYDSSLYLPTLYIAALFKSFDSFVFHIKPFYLPCLIFAIVGYFLLINDTLVVSLKKCLRFEKLVFLVCISFVVFMPVTSDYYLLLLFLPLLIFPSVKYSFGYFMVYGLLLGAKNIFFFKVTNTLSQTFDVSYQALINPVLLLILLFGEFNLAGSIKRQSSNLDTEHPPHLAERTDWQFFFPLKPYRKIILLFTAMTLVAGVTIYQVKEAQRRAHNIEIGLPVDFDPVIYLRLNPGLEEYWKSSGINDGGQRLLEHAEEHYKGFGAKDGWPYKYNRLPDIKR